jgi:hypothetical protein
VSYFRPQKAGKIGPRTVHSFSDSTSRLSQNAGQVKIQNGGNQNCLKTGVHSMTAKLDGWSSNSVGKCFIIITYFMSGRSAAW